MNHMLHLLAFKMGLSKPETQTSFAEQERLKELAAGTKNICEVGVFEGFNTALMSAELKEGGVLFGVDPFFSGRLGLSYHKLITISYLKRKKVFNRVKLIECLSQEVGDRVPNELDLVFIDGDHSLAGITGDWSVYREKVKVGGVIALHDSIHESGSKMGSHDYFESHISSDSDFEVIDTVDSLAVLKRIK